MHLFTFFTKLLLYLPGEFSHYVALKSLKVLHLTGLLRILIRNQSSPIEIDKSDLMVDLRNMTNKIGIAAGLDKNGDYIDCLASLGVGFIEVGTVTPRPQQGNAKPRIFKNLKDKSITNRLGFNNKGVDYLVDNLKKRTSKIIIGASIGKNFDTPVNEANKDYLNCLKKVYRYSDYVAVNISSPNTKDLRKLSSQEHLNLLLKEIKSEQEALSSVYGYKPVFLKISPDEKIESLELICNSILSYKLDGIICTNTTTDHINENSKGGLSGTPLRNKATRTLIQIKSLIGNKLTIIASGGVMNVSDYKEKIDAGADLVQIYTGFIYEGPKLIKDILNFNSDQ